MFSLLFRNDTHAKFLFIERTFFVSLCFWRWRVLVVFVASTRCEQNYPMEFHSLPIEIDNEHWPSRHCRKNKYIVVTNNHVEHEIRTVTIAFQCGASSAIFGRKKRIAFLIYASLMLKSTEDHFLCVCRVLIVCVCVCSALCLSRIVRFTKQLSTIWICITQSIRLLCGVVSRWPLDYFFSNPFTSRLCFMALPAAIMIFVGRFRSIWTFRIE